MHPHVVQDDKDRVDTRIEGLLESLKKVDALHGSLTGVAATEYLARARVEGRQEVQGTAALVCVFDRTG